MGNGGTNKNMVLLIKNKKGIFLTSLALIMISIFLLSYTMSNVIQERKTIEKRISTMNSFLTSTEEDASRQLYIFGYRMIFVWEDEILKNGSYVTNLNSSLEEGFFNGTYRNTTNQFINDTRFSDLNNSINTNAKKVGVKINLSNPRIIITQDDPWNVKITLISNFTMEDLGNLASWNKTSIISAYIPIQNFEDPIYVINTNARITHKFMKTPYSPLVSGTDVSNLSSHVDNSYYIANSASPSFLDRLQGNLSAANPNGIESFVNLEKLTVQGIPIKDKSCVDFIYFSDTNPGKYSVSGLPAWFRIDDQSNRLAFYNLTSLATPS